MEMSEDFDRALAFTLRWEGGYVNDPADPGGATNRGITQRTYDQWRYRHGEPTRDVSDITKDEVSAIYRSDYWDACRCDELPWPLSVVVFDGAVNCGPHRSIRWMQRELHVAPDGIIGPKTLHAVNLSEADVVAVRCIGQREQYYCALVDRRPSLGKFLLGWLRRTHALRDYIRWSDEPTQPTKSAGDGEGGKV